MNSFLEVGDPIARCGLEGNPETLVRMGGGTNGSLLRSDMYAGGPSNGVKNLSFPSRIVSKSSGREIGESDRRFNGKEHIRQADVRIKMLYVR